MNPVKLYTIVDLDEITLDGLNAYLRDNGWRIEEPSIRHGTFWTKDEGHLLVPHKPDTEIIRTLAEFSSSTEVDVFDAICLYSRWCAQVTAVQRRSE